MSTCLLEPETTLSRWVASDDVAPADSPASSPSSVKMYSNRKPRVLLADDHPIVLERVTAVLQSGCDIVGTVSDGRTLIQEALRLNPDVIVLDITMPHLTGVEAARELRQRGSTSELVFLTIHQGQRFLDACLAEGAVGYVTKLRLNSDLLTAVKHALSGQQFISPSISHN